MKKLIRRTKRRRNLANIKAGIFVGLVLITLALVVTFFYKISSGVSTSSNVSLKPGTFSYAGFLFPKMPQSYRAIHRQSGSLAEIDYLTSQTIDQVANDIQALCTGNGFKINALNTLTSNDLLPKYQSDSVSQCANNNDTWDFDAYNAGAINYQSWKNSISSSIMKKDLSHYTWLRVTSTGAPILNGSTRSTL